MILCRWVQQMGTSVSNCWCSCSDNIKVLWEENKTFLEGMGGDSQRVIHFSHFCHQFWADHFNHPLFLVYIQLVISSTVPISCPFCSCLVNYLLYILLLMLLQLLFYLLMPLLLPVLMYTCRGAMSWNKSVCHSTSFMLSLLVCDL